jgi:hypothetical protein
LHGLQCNLLPCRRWTQQASTYKPTVAAMFHLHANHPAAKTTADHHSSSLQLHMQLHACTPTATRVPCTTISACASSTGHTLHKAGLPRCCAPVIRAAHAHNALCRVGCSAAQHLVQGLIANLRGTSPVSPKCTAATLVVL